MNLNKAELKIAVLNEVGNVLDDQREAADRQLQQAIGAKAGLLAARRDLNSIFEAADRGVDEGAIPDLEALALVKAWLSKAAASLEVKAKHFENVEIQTVGKVQQASLAVELLSKMHKGESDRVRNFMAQIESGAIVIEDDGSLSQGDVTRRSVGIRPGQSIAAQRKAEEAAAKANGKAPETPAEPAEEKPKGKAAKKPTKRKTAAKRTTKSKKADKAN